MRAIAGDPDWAVTRWLTADSGILGHLSENRRIRNRCGPGKFQRYAHIEADDVAGSSSSNHILCCVHGSSQANKDKYASRFETTPVAKLTWVVDMRSQKLALELAEFSFVRVVQLHLPGLQAPGLTVVADGSGVALPSVFEMATQSWGRRPKKRAGKRRTHLPALRRNVYACSRPELRASCVHRYEPLH